MREAIIICRCCVDERVNLQVISFQISFQQVQLCNQKNFNYTFLSKSNCYVWPIMLNTETRRENFCNWKAAGSKQQFVLMCIQGRQWKQQKQKTLICFPYFFFFFFLIKHQFGDQILFNEYRSFAFAANISLQVNTLTSSHRRKWNEAPAKAFNFNWCMERCWERGQKNSEFTQMKQIHPS